jgi:hypothetical protein
MKLAVDLQLSVKVFGTDGLIKVFGTNGLILNPSVPKTFIESYNEICL